MVNMIYRGFDLLPDVLSKRDISPIYHIHISVFHMNISISLDYYFAVKYALLCKK